MQLRINGRTLNRVVIDPHYRERHAEPVVLDERPYRVVLLLCLTDDYLGVINAFRVDA